MPVQEEGFSRREALESNRTQLRTAVHDLGAPGTSPAAGTLFVSAAASGHGPTAPQQRVAGDGGSTDGVPGARTPVAAARPRPPAPPDLLGSLRCWDRYLVRGLLGQGGMGRVYRAVDPRLGRPVALKFLRSQDPELASLVLAEARAQARIEHPNVCKVYEAGELDGRAYIAMQLVEGLPLGRAALVMSLEQKVLAVRDAAEALHAAHRLGILHRDVKPANIVAERREDGGWTPYVMDFGLARTADDPGATAQDSVMGTPAFMAPEQALGRVRSLDRRTDVYSLGATLFAVLTGSAPFKGDSSLEVLRQVLETDPPAPRKQDSAIPRDLEHIVLKCLEKAPERRYDSAQALAEDLGRFLDGEPVLARSPGLLYRLRKRAARHKAAAALGAASLLLVVASASAALHTRWQATAMAEMAQDFGQDVKEIELVMRFASFLLPLHDVSRERRLVREAMDRIEAKMEALGPLAMGPGNHALGRGYLALGDHENARMCLAKKWMLGQHGADLADALGRALAGLYLGGLRELWLSSEPAERQARRSELDEQYRLPALDFLQRGIEEGGDADGTAEALVALLQRDYEWAIRRALAAAEDVPWLYEAWALAAEAHTQRALEWMELGLLALAAEDLERAQAAYREAATIARSYPQAYVGLCSASVQRMEVARLAGTPLEAHHAEAVAACQSALRADPHLAFASLLLTEAHRRLDEALPGPVVTAGAS
jgi:eukaryotic-like serine/threonine-protein kinase